MAVQRVESTVDQSGAVVRLVHVVTAASTVLSPRAACPVAGRPEIVQELDPNAGRSAPVTIRGQPSI